MSSPRQISPIRVLPRQLADQIAAGEVIERPASVLKELIENSLDAGSMRLDIELLHGGMESIRVTDDGYGIPGIELPLAVCRHATSKISQLDDLLHLQSLGFRGEALASICSVSQWEITSHREGEQTAFSMRHDQGQALVPLNHAVGTSVWIRNLFFNTPARRKFLRAERTEFRHCDDVFRRMALARFDVAFYLKHNNRQVHRLPAVADDIGRSRRVSMLCGEAFARNSLVIDFPRSDMRLWGWISKPEFSRQQNDLQFFYINGRVIRDRVINHALRVAYQSLLPPGRYAAFVLHLELDPAVVDVNVHPTKHEVRFRESRQIHDFLIRCLREGLHHPLRLAGRETAVAVNESAAEYRTASQNSAREAIYDDSQTHHESFFGNVQALVLNRFLLTQSSAGLYLIDVSRAQAMLNCRRWQQAFESGEIKSCPVLIPLIIHLTTQQVCAYEQHHQQLTRLGFDLTQVGPAQLLLRAVPVWLQGVDYQHLLLSLIDSALSSSPFAVIEQSFTTQQLDISRIDLKQFLGALSQQSESLAACWRKLTEADLSAWLLEQHTQHE